jgi:hypothetical protein
MIEAMRRLVLLPLVLLAAAATAAPVRHFDLSVSFVAASKAGRDASVAVTFRPLDQDVRVNESPAPRLKLDLAQTVLVDRQPPATGVPDYDPLTARYLDLSKPVLFPVAVGPTAPRGEQLVKGAVVYFYCSKREAWCRRGTTEIEIPITVR